MRTVLLFLGLLFVSPDASTEPPKRAIPNHFFVLHNAIRGDSTYKSFDQQVALIKSLGYDGVEINQLESFEGMKAALDKHQFTGSYFYIRINVDSPQLDPRVEPYIRALKGSQTILAPFFISEKKQFAPSSGGADTTVVKQVRQLADWAKEAGLRVALYPHVDFYVERADHALQLVEQVNRPNVGLTFNLCHWLATRQGGPEAYRSDWKALLTKLKPRLMMITISGANDVPKEQAAKQPGGLWSEYILPLGTGSFDTYELIRYAVRDLDFRGPIGVQCYAMKGDKPTNLRNTMSVWQQYQHKFRP